MLSFDVDGGTLPHVLKHTMSKSIVLWYRIVHSVVLFAICHQFCLLWCLRNRKKLHYSEEFFVVFSFRLDLFTATQSHQKRLRNIPNFFSATKSIHPSCTIGECWSISVKRQWFSQCQLFNSFTGTRDAIATTPQPTKAFITFSFLIFVYL